MFCVFAVSGERLAVVNKYEGNTAKEVKHFLAARLAFLDFIRGSFGETDPNRFKITKYFAVKP